MKCYSWTQVINIVSKLNDRTLKEVIFRRSPLIESSYENDKMINGRDNISNRITNKLKKIKYCSIGNIKFKITKNDYPYNFEDNIIHYVVWTESNIFEMIEAFEIYGLKEFVDFIMFNNSDSIRSINLNHYHLLVKFNL